MNSGQLGGTKNSHIYGSIYLQQYTTEYEHNQGMGTFVSIVFFPVQIFCVGIAGLLLDGVIAGAEANVGEETGVVEFNQRLAFIEGGNKELARLESIKSKLTAYEKNEFNASTAQTYGEFIDNQIEALTKDIKNNAEKELKDNCAAYGSHRNSKPESWVVEPNYHDIFINEKRYLDE